MEYEDEERIVFPGYDTIDVRLIEGRMFVVYTLQNDLGHKIALHCLEHELNREISI